MARLKRQDRKMAKLKKLINVVGRGQCKIICNDVVKDLMKKEVAVEVERVKCQPRANVRKKVSLFKKASPRKSVMKIKKKNRRRKEQIVLQV